MPRLRSQHFHVRLLAALLVAAGSVFAGETTGSMDEEGSRITEFSDTVLPGTLREDHITLHFKPKFGDFRDYEYVRLPFEVRYGFSDRWQFSAGLTPFIANPINRGRDHRWGLGESEVGTRYDVGRSLNFFDATTIGVDTRIPIGKPPIALNDGYTHVKPWFAGTRELRTWPDLTFYINLSYDRTVVLTRHGEPPPGVIRTNVIEVDPGLLLFKSSEFAYFTEYHFRHIAEELTWHLAHEVRFGTIWNVPLARTERWNLPGKWQVELAYEGTHEEGLSTHQRVVTQVNWRTSLREMLDFTHAK